MFSSYFEKQKEKKKHNKKIFIFYSTPPLPFPLLLGQLQNDLVEI